jgi:hypothetical protein
MYAINSRMVVLPNSATAFNFQYRRKVVSGELIGGSSLRLAI